MASCPWTFGSFISALVCAQRTWISSRLHDFESPGVRPKQPIATPSMPLSSWWKFHAPTFFCTDKKKELCQRIALRGQRWADETKELSW